MGSAELQGTQDACTSRTGRVHFSPSTQPAWCSRWSHSQPQAARHLLPQCLGALAPVWQAFAAALDATHPATLLLAPLLRRPSRPGAAHAATALPKLPCRLTTHPVMMS